MIYRITIALLLIGFCSISFAHALKSDLKNFNKIADNSISDVRCYFAMAMVHKHLGESISEYGVFRCTLDHSKKIITIALKKTASSLGAKSYDLNMRNMSIIKIEYQR